MGCQPARMGCPRESRGESYGPARRRLAGARAFAPVLVFPPAVREASRLTPTHVCLWSPAWKPWRSVWSCPCFRRPRLPRRQRPPPPDRRAGHRPAGRRGADDYPGIVEFGPRPGRAARRPAGAAARHPLGQHLPAGDPMASAARHQPCSLTGAPPSRWGVEHAFRLAKTEVGFGHFEGRSWLGLLRHMILCQVVLLFVAEQAGRLRGEKPGGDDGAGGPGARRRLRPVARPASPRPGRAARGRGGSATTSGAITPPRSGRGNGRQRDTGVAL